MITSTKGSPNNIIHPTRARNTGFGKENFGRVMMSVVRRIMILAMITSTLIE